MNSISWPSPFKLWFFRWPRKVQIFLQEYEEYIKNLEKDAKYYEHSSKRLIAEIDKESYFLLHALLLFESKDIWILAVQLCKKIKNFLCRGGYFLLPYRELPSPEVLSNIKRTSFS